MYIGRDEELSNLEINDDAYENNRDVKLLNSVPNVGRHVAKRAVVISRRHQNISWVSMTEIVKLLGCENEMKQTKKAPTLFV